MAESLEHGTLWSLVRALESQAVKGWRQKFRPAVDLEEALANDVRTIETTIARRPDGNVSVTVSVIAKRPHHNNVDAFALQRTGKDAYRTFLET